MSMILSRECGKGCRRESGERVGRRGGMAHVVLSLIALAGLATLTGAFSAPVYERDVTRAHFAKRIEREIVAERLAPRPSAALVATVVISPQPAPAEPAARETATAGEDPYGEALSPWLAATAEADGQ